MQSTDNLLPRYPILNYIDNSKNQLIYNAARDKNLMLYMSLEADDDKKKVEKLRTFMKNEYYNMGFFVLLTRIVNSIEYSHNTVALAVLQGGKQGDMQSYYSTWINIYPIPSIDDLLDLYDKVNDDERTYRLIGPIKEAANDACKIVFQLIMSENRIPTYHVGSLCINQMIID